MQECEIDVAVSKEVINVINLLRTFSASGTNYGFSRFRDSGKQRPVGSAAARNLDHVDVMVHGGLDRRLIERGYDDPHAGITDTSAEATELGLT